MFGGLGGDFYTETHEPKLFGMHMRSVLGGWNANTANTDLKMSILPIRQMGNVYVHRVNRVVFSMFGGLGDFCCFVRTHMRQSCVGCILEVF